MNWKTASFRIATAISIVFSTSSVPAQIAPGNSARMLDWWKNAVIYEIYPRSFQDSNGDGIGDINGITQRLDYLQELGIDAIWIAPCYPSPLADFGYDVSDYTAIDPAYGTLADFEHLVSEAKKRNIRVIMDMVMNHTSDQHKWFIASRSSRNDPYRNWYVWKDGKGETETDRGALPNNWLSELGHSAWQWDEMTRQYYYHKFAMQQPDLNWYNPKIHEAFKNIIGFWLKRGVAGFRFDAITTLFEDTTLADENVVLDKDGKPMINDYGDTVVDGVKTEYLPGVHDVVAEMRAYMDSFGKPRFPGTRVLIGETYLPDIAGLAKEYGTEVKPEFQLPMDTQVGFINELNTAAFRAKINEVETQISGNTPLLVFDNHDNPRLDIRYGDGIHDTDIQRVISAVLFASRGAALFYYGDEIGMKTTPPTRREDVRDPVGILGWPKVIGRDGERTPMQWDPSPNAGFTTSTATSWLRVPSSSAMINVQAERADPNSLFVWYRTLIQLKKAVPALARGDQVMLDTSNGQVLSWLRQVPGSSAIIVSCNFSAQPQTVQLVFSGATKELKTLLKSPGAVDPKTSESIPLGPFGVYIGELR